MESSRLVYNQLSVSEEDFFIYLFSSPVIMEHISDPLSQVEAELLFAKFVGEMTISPPKTLVWVIKEKITSSPLGIVSLMWRDIGSVAAPEFGIMLDVKAQGKSFPTEISISINKYIRKNKLGIAGLHAYCAKKNFAMQKQFQLMGYTCSNNAESVNGEVLQKWIYESPGENNL
jgi:RimJ/RimL family protein N-acetyltransferase